MMRVSKQTIAVLVALFLGLLSAPIFAQSDNANPAAFGIGKPVHIQDLPDSAFRNKLLSLPPQARAKALKWMQEFTFPAADVANLRVDQSGGIYYAEPDLLPQDAPAVSDTPITANAITASETFLLHSRPGSSNVVYLDFDGHSFSSTAWSSGTIVALPFDPSGNDSPATVANFTSTELDRIGEIWHRIAEDLAPWNIDVTTEEPASFTSTTGRVLITNHVDASGALMPSSGGGGVAYVNVFGNSNYATYYSPALVYYTHLGTGYAPYVAEASTHEFGHNIGMGHDGTSTVGYYEGHGSGFVSWGPIMGVGYYTNVTQWSKGEYTDANNSQDDLVMITSDLGYIPDDHGDTSATATEIVVHPVGDILVSSPETDPHNDLPQNKGIINNRTDVDWFYVDVGAGDITIIASPGWHSFLRSSLRGANLDVELTLYDSSLTQIAYSEPVDNTFATVTVVGATAGRYFIKIDGVGNNVGQGYSDYGSLGMYFIEGAVTPVSPDGTIPTPDPMQFAVGLEPAAVDAYSIDMTAVTATDDSGFLEYEFQCVSGGGGCATSAWQTSTYYVATGLDPNTAYTYAVRVRDSSFNTTAYSTSASATTEQAPPDAPTNLTGSVITISSILVGWTDVSTEETAYNLERSPNGVDTWTVFNLPANATSYNDTGLSGDTTYYYRVSASNAIGSSTYLSGSFATLPLPPDGVPNTLAATAVSMSQINLTWVESVTNESGIEIQRSLDESVWSTVTTVAADSTAYSNTGLNAATLYYYRVRATNAGGNSDWSTTASARTDYSCQASKAMTINRWETFSLPCNPNDATIGGVFTTNGSGLNTGNYGSTWVVYVYENLTNVAAGRAQGYSLLGLGDDLEEGKGYYFYTTQSSVTVHVKGVANTGADIPLRTEAVNGIYNLVGNPHNGQIAWTDTQVNNGGFMVNWSAFDKASGPNNPTACTKAVVDTKCFMSWKMNKWEATQYNTFDGQTNTEGTLNAFDAVWVQAHTSNILLSIPAPAAAPPAEAKPTEKKGNNTGGKKTGGSKGEPWYVRLIAESGNSRDTGNWLGQLKDVSDGPDSRDLEEFSPFGGSYLTILFTNPLFAEVNWGYTTDYRKLTRTPQGEWPFVVRASGEFSEVKLTWEGDAALIENVLLIDEVSGETITVSPDGSYLFNMTGGEHAFRWILP